MIEGTAIAVPSFIQLMHSSVSMMTACSVPVRCTQKSVQPQQLIFQSSHSLGRVAKNFLMSFSVRAWIGIMFFSLKFIRFLHFFLSLPRSGYPFREKNFLKVRFQKRVGTSLSKSDFDFRLRTFRLQTPEGQK